MSNGNPGKCAVLGLLVFALVDCSIASVAAAGDLETISLRGRNPATTRSPAIIEDSADVVGTITPRGSGSITEADLAEHARAAQTRFLVLRAVIEHEMPLRQVVSKDELAGLEINMKELSAHLSVLAQAHDLQSSNKARNALDPAQEWDQACSKVINELRAAVERDRAHHEALSKDELAALESNMKRLSAQLSTLVQSHNFQSRNKARNALDLAQDWYQTALKVINPPADGVTELPLPTSVSDKADLVAGALDEVLAEAKTYASASRPLRLSQKRASN